MTTQPQPTFSYSPRKEWKYKTDTLFVERVSIFPEVHIITEHIELSPDGKLAIKAGYAWDGPSGPALDTPSGMRASLVHDALYQLMRMGLLPILWRKEADLELRRIAREDGMSFTRARYWYWAVRMFATKTLKHKEGVL